MSRLMIFTIALIVFGQAPLWAQDDHIYQSQPNIIDLASPVEIRVAEDLDLYLEADDTVADQPIQTSRLASARPLEPSRRQVSSTEPMFELTSENWFANYDVAPRNDTLTPSLESQPVQVPEELDFRLNDLDLIASMRQTVENEFAEATPDTRYQTRSTVIKRQAGERESLLKYRTAAPAAIASRSQFSSPSDATSSRVAGIDLRERPRRLVAAQDQRFLPRAPVQRSSALPWLMLPLIAAPLTWFGVRHYREQKAEQGRATACGGCEKTQLQCEACPAAEENAFRQCGYSSNEDSQTMHVQRSAAIRGQRGYRSNEETQTMHVQERSDVRRQANDDSQTMHYQRRGEAIRGQARTEDTNVGTRESAQDRRASQTSSVFATNTNMNEGRSEFVEGRRETSQPGARDTTSRSIPIRQEYQPTGSFAAQNERAERDQSTEREFDREITREASKSNDDLTRIFGIGPATSGILQREGISSFSDVAATDVGTLESILGAAGKRFQLINPTTWPTQAQYAARGDWEGLDAWREAELESMATESEEIEFVADCNFQEEDCEQEIAVLEDANSLLASVGRIRREADFDDEVRLEELEDGSGYEQSRYDEFDYEERGEFQRFESGTRNGAWSDQEDDLTEIRGIGSATKELLRDNGIRNFQDLAESDLTRVQDILDRAGSRFQTANPEAWIAQAREFTGVTR